MGVSQVLWVVVEKQDVKKMETSLIKRTKPSRWRGQNGGKMAIKVIKSTSQFPVTFGFTGVLTDNMVLFTGTP